MIAVDGRPVVLQRRAPDGTILLRLRMPTRSGEPRTQMIDHEWFLRDSPSRVLDTISSAVSTGDRIPPARSRITSSFL
jgi:hypothetical protein